MTVVIWKVPAAPWQTGHSNWRSAWITHGMSISLRLRQFRVQTTPFPFLNASSQPSPPHQLSWLREEHFGVLLLSPQAASQLQLASRPSQLLLCSMSWQAGIIWHNSDKLCCDSQLLLYPPRRWVRPGTRILPSCPQARLQQGGGLRPPTSARDWKSN